MARANTLDFKRRSFIPSKLATGALVEAGHWLVGRSELHLHEKRLLIWTFRACCLSFVHVSPCIIASHNIVDSFFLQHNLSRDLVRWLHRMNVRASLAAEPSPSLRTALHHEQVPAGGAEKHGDPPPPLRFSLCERGVRQRNNLQRLALSRPHTQCSHSLSQYRHSAVLTGAREVPAASIRPNITLLPNSFQLYWLTSLAHNTALSIAR